MTLKRPASIVLGQHLGEKPEMMCRDHKSRFMAEATDGTCWCVRCAYLAIQVEHEALVRLINVATPTGRMIRKALRGQATDTGNVIAARLLALDSDPER